MAGEHGIGEDVLGKRFARMVTESYTNPEPGGVVQVGPLKKYFYGFTHRLYVILIVLRSRCG